MEERRPLSELLTRVYWWGWAGISPLAVITGPIGFPSFDLPFRHLLTGLWAGVLNLGLLWTGIFLLIVIGSVFVVLLDTRTGLVPFTTVATRSCDVSKEIVGFLER